MATIYEFPNWTTNPYTNMLLLEARARGWSVRGSAHFQTLMRELDTLNEGDVLHVQWTSPISSGAARSEFHRRIKTFSGSVGNAKRRGVKVIWTVHNLVAHDTSNHDLEVQLAKALATLADLVIILNSHTVSAAEPFFSIPPSKVFHLPHPSYVGVYPPAMPRQEVEAHLGIPQGVRTIGFVGAIRPYKGVGDLLNAARVVAERLPRIGVVLAGATSEWAMKEVDGHVPHSLPLFRRHTQLSDDEIALWSSACDVIVLPYRGILNSGSLHLAATFGIPVVLPALPHLTAEYGDQEWITFFDDADGAERHRAIASAIEQSLNHGTAARRSARAFASSYTPFDMSVRFADLLDDFCGT